MIPTELVSRTRWNSTLGAALKERRTSQKISRAKLIRAVSDCIEPPAGRTVSKLKAGSCSNTCLQRLERGEPDSVAVELLEAIALALNTDIESLLGVPKNN